MQEQARVGHVPAGAHLATERHCYRGSPAAALSGYCVPAICLRSQFHARAGDEERALTALRKRAAATIRDCQAEAVLVSQRADTPHHLLWIQHRAGPSVPAVDGTESLPSIEAGLVMLEGAPVRVTFVDGTYQFPLPPCRVWRLETRDAETGRALLNVSRLAGSDPRIGGVSVYRTTEGPCRTIAFLALAPDVTPGECLDVTTPLTVYRLRVRWTVGRLTPERRQSRRWFGTLEPLFGHGWVSSRRCGPLRSPTTWIRTSR